MVGTLLSATAVLSLVFGLGLALIPEVLLSIFNVRLEVNASLFARSLGGSWLGYALLNWQARGAAWQSQRAILLADLIVAVSGLVLSLYTLTLGASPLVWLWVALFVAFGAWQAYAIWLAPPPA